MRTHFPLERIADGLAIDYLSVATPASQRVQNGDFSLGSLNWNLSGGGWTVAGGQATNAVLGAFLTNTLNSSVTSGLSFSLQLTVVANVLGTAIQVQLYNSATTASQLIFADGATPGLKTASGTVSGTFDQLRIRTIDDISVVITGVGLIA